MKKEELLKNIKVNNYLEWHTSLYAYSVFIINRGDLFRSSDSIYSKQIDDINGIYIEDNPSHLLFNRNEKGECIDLKEHILFIKSGDDVIYESDSYKGVENEDEDYFDKDQITLSDFENEEYKGMKQEPSNPYFQDQIPTTDEVTDWRDYLDNDYKEQNDSNFIYKISSEYLEMSKLSKPSDADFKVKKDENSLEINISFKFK